MRVLVRRERPHPGATISVFEAHDGWRYQCVATDTRRGQLPFLEARHRAHARVEDRVKAIKQTGMGRFPSREFAINQVWLQLALTAADLIAWTQTILLDGALAAAEPKKLRYQLLHTAARIVHGQRRTRSKSTPAGPGPPSSPPRSTGSPRSDHPCSSDQPAPPTTHHPRTQENRTPGRAPDHALSRPRPINTDDHETTPAPTVNERRRLGPGGTRGRSIASRPIQRADLWRWSGGDDGELARMRWDGGAEVGAGGGDFEHRPVDDDPQVIAGWDRPCGLSDVNPNVCLPCGGSLIRGCEPRLILTSSPGVGLQVMSTA